MAVSTQRRRGAETVRKVRLGDVCNLVRGVSYKPHDAVSEAATGYVPLLRANNIGTSGLNHDELVYVKRECVHEDQFVRKGDLLVCASSGSKHLVGKAAQISSDRKETFGAFCKVIRPDARECDFNYFANYFQSDVYRRTISDKAAGANINNIRSEHLEDLQIPLPPLPEQKRIAAELDKICELKKNAETRLEKLDLLVKSRFVEMFGDVTVNDRGWETATLPELGELNRGVSKARPRNSPELLGGPYPLVQTGDVSNSGLWIKNYSSTYSDKGLAQSRLWKRGTLCITIAANIAQTAILDFDACFPDSVVGFVPNERTDAIFIHYWFSFFQKILEAQAPQVAQKNINLRILSGLKVVEPPLALQREFAAFVEKVDKLKVVAKKSVEQMDTLYRAKLQEYFG